MNNQSEASVNPRCHAYLLCIGSNDANRRRIIENAAASLSLSYDVRGSSPIVESADEEGGPWVYANRVVEVATPLSAVELKGALLEMESRYGRDRSLTAVSLDIDIVEADGKVIKPSDAGSDYYRTCKASLRRHFLADNGSEQTKKL